MLEKKVVLITGSSRGIGAATARLAKQYGASVIVHGKTRSPQLSALAKELDAIAIVCDVADQAAVTAAVAQAIKKHKRIDALVNCAGIAPRATLLESNDDSWLDMFKVNVLGTAHFCKAVIPYMQKAKFGRIVNISSVRGFANTSGRPGYSVTKGGIIALTGSLAKEFAPHIAVNAVAPGFTKTDISKLWDDGVWKQANSSLAARAAEPAEIAEAILFLASDRASFITGQTLVVDGGYSLSGK